MAGAPKDSKEYTPDSFKVLLKKLVQSPDEFTPEDCASAFRHLAVNGAAEAQVRLQHEAHCKGYTDFRPVLS